MVQLLEKKLTFHTVSLEHIDFLLSKNETRIVPFIVCLLEWLLEYNLKRENWGCIKLVIKRDEINKIHNYALMFLYDKMNHFLLLLI